MKIHKMISVDEEYIQYIEAIPNFSSWVQKELEIYMGKSNSEDEIEKKLVEIEEERKKMLIDYENKIKKLKTELQKIQEFKTQKRMEQERKEQERKNKYKNGNDSDGYWTHC